MRITKDKKVLKYAYQFDLTEKTSELLKAIIEDSQNGFIHAYNESSINHLKDIFHYDAAAHYTAIRELLDKRIISIDQYNNVLTLRTHRDYCLNNLIYQSKAKKRKYLKDPNREQGSLFTGQFTGTFGKIIEKALQKASMPIKYQDHVKKLSGVKIPEPFFPYFTGEPLSEQVANTLLKDWSSELVLEEMRRDLDKEELRALFACFFLADPAGMIRDYNRHSIYQTLIQEFGKDAFSLRTWYNAIRKLIDLGILSEIQEDDIKHLRINNYEAAIANRSHYVMVPNVVLFNAFKKLELAAIKLFFSYLFKLNNGEDTDGKKIKFSGQSKALYFKINKQSRESKESQIKFEQQREWLKKRNSHELVGAIIGGYEDSDFLGLGEYFHLNFISETVLQLRIRNEYFITKKTDKIKKLLCLQGKYRRRSVHIEMMLKENKIDYSIQDIISFLNIFRKEKLRVIEKMIAYLAARIKKGKSSPELGEVINPGGYMKTIYQLYQQGKFKPDMLQGIPGEI